MYRDGISYRYVIAPPPASVGSAHLFIELYLITELLQRDKAAYMAEYYKNWMHEGGKVDVPHESEKDLTIFGLDESGFLLLSRADGTTMSVQPDGNSFDIMHNLIKLK